MASLDKKAVELREDTKQRKRDRDMAQIQVEEAQRKRAKVQDALKRVVEHLVAAHEAASQAAGGGEFAPPAHAAAIKKLETQQEELRAQLSGRGAAVEKARVQLRERDKDLRAVRHAIETMAQERIATEKASSSAQNVGANTLATAQDERLDAYEAVLVQLREQHPDLLRGGDYGTRVDDVRRRLGEASIELERYELSVNAYDEEAYKRGIMLVVAAVAILVVLLVLITKVG